VSSSFTASSSATPDVHQFVYIGPKKPIDRTERPVSFPTFQTPPHPQPPNLMAHTIRFMQAECNDHTGESNQYTVLNNAKALVTGTLSVRDMPPIRVWRDVQNRVWTQDHRRLAAFRLAGIKMVPVVWTDVATVDSRAFKFSTGHEGLSITVRFSRDLGVVVR
jgi:hypothetical protein